MHADLALPCLGKVGPVSLDLNKDHYLTCSRTCQTCHAKDARIQCLYQGVSPLLGVLLGAHAVRNDLKLT
jgi:hypothetical protein